MSTERTRSTLRVLGVLVLAAGITVGVGAGTGTLQDVTADAGSGSVFESVDFTTGDGPSVMNPEVCGSGPKFDGGGGGGSGGGGGC